MCLSYVPSLPCSSSFLRQTSPSGSSGSITSIPPHTSLKVCLLNLKYFLGGYIECVVAAIVSNELHGQKYELNDKGQGYATGDEFLEEFGMSESNKVIRLCDMCICVVDKLCLNIQVARYRRAGCLPCVSAHCDLACPPLQAPHPVNLIQPLSHHHTSCLCFSFLWSNDATQPQTLKRHLSGHVGLMRGLWIVCWWLYVCWSCCGWGLCGQSIGYCCRGETHGALVSIMSEHDMAKKRP